MTIAEKAQSKVPQLRFPWFEGEWERRKISDVALVITGSTPDTSKNEYYVGEFPFVSPFDINDEPFVSETKTTLTKIGFEKGRKVKAGSSLFVCIGSSIGKVARVTKDVITNQQINAVVVADPMLESFAFYSLKKSSKKIAVLAGEQAVPIINKTQFSKVALNFPLSCDEANEIATFLSTVDKKISLLKQKHEQLVLYKKGIMQQLFSQQLRFKDDDGQDFPDWHKKKLGALTSKKGKKNKDGKSYPVYSINNKEGFLPQSDQFKGMNSEERGFDISMYKIVKKNTFAYNPARINVGSIGFSGELENIIVSSLYVCFQTKSELSDRYLMAYLDTYVFNKAVLRNAEGGVRQYLFYENFCNIRIPLPELDEQNKIADFLDSIDHKISLAQQQIEQTQAYKKGLLQQMFV